MTAAAHHLDTNQDNTTRDIDSSLVKTICKNNDHAAFTQLIGKYQKPVFTFCYRYFGNEDDAKDIAQDIFVKVYLKIHDFRGESTFSTWLFRIMVNTCVDKSKSVYFRIFKKTRYTDPAMSGNQSFQQEDHHQVKTPEDLLMNKELGEVIHSSVSALDKKQRAILILRDYHGRSYEEIANVMGLNLGTIKSSLCRARIKVADSITKTYKK